MLGRRWLGVTMVVLALGMIASTPAMGASAAAKPGAQQGEWRGKSAQGLRLIFDVLLTRRGMVVQPVDIEAIATCGATGDQIEFGFGGGQLRLHDDGTFKMNFSDPFFGQFRFNGTLGDTTGSGTVEASLAALTKGLGTQLCTSGAVPWKASAPGQGAGAAEGGHPDYMIHFGRDRSGHVTWSITKG
jgi:hypothetical protein